MRVEIMKKLLLTLACLSGFGLANASGVAIGTDAIKLLDQGQFNMFVQNAMNNKSAVVVGVGYDNDIDLELSYKLLKMFLKTRLRPRSPFPTLLALLLGQSEIATKKERKEGCSYSSYSSKKTKKKKK